MLTLRCCVVDDEPLAQELVASYIEKTPFMELVGKFSSAQDSVKTILEEDIDVVFLDIHMPQLNGMEFARIVPPTCRIIFTTAYDRYAIEGFKVNALDYRIEPISYEEVVGAATKALPWVELRRRADELDNNKRYIIVKSEYKQVQIPIDKIQFIEGLKDYVKIYVEGEKNAILTLTSMKTIERYLPAAEFLRVHRSFIVNTSKISIIERNRIVFGNHYIPVSESYKQAFNDYVAGYSLSAQRDNQPGED